MFISLEQSPHHDGYFVEASYLPKDLMREKENIEIDLKENGDYKELTVERINAHTLSFHIFNISSGWTEEKASEMCAIIRFKLLQLQKELNNKHTKGKVRELFNKCPEKEKITLVGKLLENNDPKIIAQVKSLLNSSETQLTKEGSSTTKENIAITYPANNLLAENLPTITMSKISVFHEALIRVYPGFKIDMYAINSNTLFFVLPLSTCQSALLSDMYATIEDLIKRR